MPGSARLMEKTVFSRISQKYQPLIFNFNFGQVTSPLTYSCSQRYSDWLGLDPM